MFIEKYIKLLDENITLEVASHHRYTGFFTVVFSCNRNILNIIFRLFEETGVVAFTVCLDQIGSRFGFLNLREMSGEMFSNLPSRKQVDIYMARFWFSVRKPERLHKLTIIRINEFEYVLNN